MSEKRGRFKIEVSLDQIIECGYFVRVEGIIREKGKVYVDLTEVDGSETPLYFYTGATPSGGTPWRQCQHNVRNVSADMNGSKDD